MELNRAFWLDRRTFVTGGTGLVGSWMVKRLLDGFFLLIPSVVAGDCYFHGRVRFGVWLREAA